MDKNKDLSYSFYLGGVLLPACVLCFNFNFFEFDLLIVGILLLEALVYTFLKSKLKHATLYSYVFLGGLSTSLFSVIRIGFMNVYNTIALDYSYVLGFSLNKFTINGQSLSQINLSSLIFLVIFFSIFIGPVYRYTINKKSNGKTFLITLGMSLPNFIVQIHLNWFFVLFLFIYWACLVLPSLKMYFPKKIRWRQIRVVSLTIIISSCLVFVSLPETKFKEMYAPVSVQKNIMDQINEWIQHLSFIQYQQDAVDLTTAGNRVYADIVHFEVENRNKKDIYFKTFSGSVYGENKWDILPKKNYDDSYDNRLIDFHHLISLIRVQRIMELPNYAYEQIKIVDHRRGDSYALQPYFINKIDQEYREVFDYAIKIGSDEVNYQIWNEENEEYFWKIHQIIILLWKKIIFKFLLCIQKLFLMN